MAIRFPKEGNPLYPLPADFAALTEEGQRDARVNALCLQETPEDFLLSWNLFCSWYLEPLPAGEFYKRKVDNALFHNELVHSVGAYAKNLWAVPRGFGKSTKLRELILLLLYTRPHFSIFLCRATQALAREELTRLMNQIAWNELLIRDFGQLKPKRGEGSWNYDWLWLKNKASLRGVAMESRQRGGRPDLFLLDDPEFDPKKATDLQTLRDNLEHFLFHVVLNMLEKGAGITWVGTVINRRTLLERAARGDDPRFAGWNRQTRAMEFTGSTGESEFLWSAKMDREDMEAKIAEIGYSAFAAEYLNHPMSDEEKILKLHPTYCTYALGGSGMVDTVPFLTADPITYTNPPDRRNPQPQPVSVPYGQHVKKMYRILLSDPLKPGIAPSPTSDYESVVVLGFTRPQDVLWVLDCWVGKLSEPLYLQKVWEMAKRWKVRVIGIEAVATQNAFIERFRGQWAQEALDINFLPRLMPILYSRGEEKASRIASMAWRFDTYRIKLPLVWKDKDCWRDLFFQIDNFTMDIEASLANDDAIDALAMHQKVVRAANVTRATTPAQEKIDPAAMILGGKRFIEGTTIDAGTLLDPSQLTDELLDARRKLFYAEPDEGRILTADDGRYSRIGF